MESFRSTITSFMVIVSTSLSGISYLCFLDVKDTVAIKKIIIRKPGIMPATKRRPMETSPTNP